MKMNAIFQMFGVTLVLVLPGSFLRRRPKSGDLAPFVAKGRRF